MKGRKMLRTMIAILVGSTLFAADARAQFREVRQEIYGMD